MTTILEQPADLLGLVGQNLSTTGWFEVTQQQVDRIADATGDPHRVAEVNVLYP